ncbi:unnamed protein product [Amoebophrya sp. A120]|nr:unnamed protein product [Amoebophrya sp. A120]|eukprot:GSA120T00012443001.1
MRQQMESFMKTGGMQQMMEAQKQQMRERQMNQLFQYVRNSGFDKLKQMVTNNAGQPNAFPRAEDIAGARDPQGHTFLHWGALGGDEAFCKWAVDEVGVPVEMATFNGQTPLMWATIQGHVQIMRMLISRGADIKRRDSLGATPFLLAIQHKQKLAFLLLLQRDRQVLDEMDINGCGAVHWAAYKADIMNLKFLDYFQADFQHVDFAKMSPLHRAVASGSIEVCEFLLKRKVNPYLKTKDGEDCMQLAAKDKNNPYLHTSLTALVKKLADPALVPESLPETQIIGARVGEEPKAADATTTATKEKSSFANDMQKMLDEPDFQKYLVPCMYLGAATLALYVHVQYLAVVGSEAAPMLTVIVWIMVPMAIIAFVQMTQSHPGAWPKRPIGRSAVEEIMADIDSDEKFDEKRLHRLCTETWIEKDLRTKYCSTSKMCVREFDHYCGWLGVPIGRDNNRRFVMLCLWEFFTQLAHFALIWYCIVSEAMKDNPENGVWGTIVFTITNYTIIAVSLFSHVVTLPWLLCLTSYHLRLVSRNLTTNEVMNMHRYEHFWQLVSDPKGQVKKNFVNPWDKGGSVSNCMDFWWTRKRGEFGPCLYKQLPQVDLELQTMGQATEEQIQKARYAVANSGTGQGGHAHQHHSG